MATKWPWNGLQGLILSAFCAIFRAEPDLEGLGVGLGVLVSVSGLKQVFVSGL